MLTAGIIRGPQDRDTMDKTSQPPLIPMAPFHPQFFISPANYVPMPSAAAAAATNTSGDSSLTNVGVASWTPLAPLRAAAAVPGASCFSPAAAAEVYYANSPGSCIIPMAGTVDTKPTSIQVLGDSAAPVIIDPSCKPSPPPPSLSQRAGESSEQSLQIKQENTTTEEKQSCTQRTSPSSSGDTQASYPINALIDMPGSLNRGSRTSSLNSSLSSFRFGGSLSQLWAASLSSLSGKVPNMKSTGNLHAESVTLPSLGNQYYAFGGSLPELSLTSLTRLLPTSSSGGTSTDQQVTSTAAPGMYTFFQPPLYVYPSQPHLATPFINPNGSITFGSFLSSGSSLCSSQKVDSPSSPSSIKQRSPGSSSKGASSSVIHKPSSPSPVPNDPTSVSVNPHHPKLSSPSSISSHPLNNLSTLAYAAAAARKTTDTATTPQDLPPSTIIRQDSSPASSSSFSPTKSFPEALDCTTALHPPISSSSSSTASGHIPMHYMNGSARELDPIVDEDNKQTMGGYSEVRHFPHLPPVDDMLGPRPAKRERKDKPYKCDHPGCGRYFSFPAHLRSHVQQIHISYRPCKCDFPGCGKRFYTPQHLNVHQRIHTGERPFVCPYAECSKAFTTAGNLKNHIRTHTGERPYACKFEGCTKRFAEMSSLKKHELTHTGEKPYKCRVCGKAFSQAGSRNTHERKHSRSEEEEEGKLSRRYRIKRIASGSETPQD